MKKFITLSLSMVFAGWVSAQNVFLTEHFNYNPGTTLQSNGWNAHSAGTTNPILVSNGGLELPQTGYLGNSIGNAALVNNTGSDENRPFSAYPDSGNVYVSFLMRVNGAVTTANAGFFFHMGQYSNTTTPVFTSVSTAFRARTFIAPGATADKFRLGLAFNSATVPSGPGDITNELDTGTTYLVVVKYQFVPGTLNDSVSLFVFNNGANIATEPATPAIGPLAGSASDMDVAQYVALRQYNAGQNITVDGIIAQDTWAMVPPAVAPTLVSPLNNAVITINGPALAQVNITWNAAGNMGGAPTYQWQLTDRASGNFNPPLLSLASNNNGTSANLSVNLFAIENALAALGLNVGDTLEAQWRVRAFRGTDTLVSNVFNLNLVRGYMVAPLSPFGLIAPPDSTLLVVGPNATGNAVISWQASTAGTQPVIYEWLATAAGGSFSTPLATLPSDNNGSDTLLTLPLTAIDALLGTLGINPGDTVALDWTVVAAVDSANTLQANQTWRIILVRASSIGVEAWASERALRVYPNPASNHVSVEIPGGFEGQVSAKLHDATGKLVYAQEGHHTPGTPVQLAWGQLPAGAYVLQVQAGPWMKQEKIFIR